MQNAQAIPAHGGDGRRMPSRMGTRKPLPPRDPSRLRDAVVAWVQANGANLRERRGELHFDWPGTPARREPKVMVHADSGAGWDAKEATRVNAVSLAERNGLTLPAFLERWAPTAGTTPAPVVPIRPPTPAPAEDPAAVEDRASSLEAAWDALLHIRDEHEEADTARVERMEANTWAWLENTRGLFPLPHVLSHVRVVDELDAGPLLAVQPNIARFLPVAVTTRRHPVTGRVRGLAWRQTAGGERRVFTGTKHEAPDGAPLVYGSRVDLVDHASLVVVVEGMADTLALEGITPAPARPEQTPPVVIMGAVDAGQLRKLGTWLARHIRPDARVLVLPHLDADTPDAPLGTGELAAGDMLGALQGHPVAAVNWQRWVCILMDAGLPPDVDVKDAADVVKACRAAGIPAHAVWDALVMSVAGKGVQL